MRVAVIAHIRHPIAEPFMGGMEAHAKALCAGLREAGHEVTLLAAAGSEDPDLEALCEAPYEQVLPFADWRGTPELARYQRAAFARAFAVLRERPFDVVHNNSLYPGVIEGARAAGLPMVSSQHVPPFKALAEAVRGSAGARHAQFTFASASQLPLWFDDPPANANVVHNGVDCALWRPRGERSGRFIWTGRITPTKGLREAVAAAARAGAALDIAGPIEDEAYFEESMAQAGGGEIAYLGQLEADALAPLVARAEAALVTPLWDEPFGLVAAEALASGVPVIAFDRGAMREVVGDCGALVRPGDVAELAAAMNDAGRFDRRACRERALAHFSVPAMVRGYESAYRRARAPAGSACAASASSCSSTAALLA